MVPISLTGLGGRESAFAYLFICMAIALILGLWWDSSFSARWCCAIIGGILELTDRGNQRAIKGCTPEQVNHVLSDRRF